MSRFSRARARARETLRSMLGACSPSMDAAQGPSPAPSPAPSRAADSVQALRELIERMQAELKFEKTRNEALNFEIARLKRWRFGSASESLDGSTQAVLPSS